jgi:DNA repair exonuclease SbcCD nuclease subunit
MIVLVSDLHLGTNRTANTTLQSRKKLQDELFGTAVRTLVRYKAKANTLIVAGDLFDNDTNDERTILQGFKIAEMCDVILAGNHDLPNRDGKVSSLQLLDEMTGKDGTVVIPKVGDVRIEQGVAKCGTNITLIPHHATQELFDQAIDQAVRNPIGGLVITHCNFDSDRALHDDASLNITRKQAQALFDAGYEYVLNGHEHKHSAHMGGRFVNLGNTHPTSMGDISDKYVWTYSQSEGLTKHLIWDTADYVPVELTDDTLNSTLVSGQFIDLSGEISPESGPALAEFIKGCFDNENTLMVRNRVGYTTDKLVNEANQINMLHNLADQVAEDLKDSDLADLWSKYRTEAGE